MLKGRGFLHHSTSRLRLNTSPSTALPTPSLTNLNANNTQRSEVLSVDGFCARLMSHHLISAPDLSTQVPSRTIIVLHCVPSPNVVLQSVPGAIVFVTPSDSKSLVQELNRVKATTKKQRIICLATEGVEEAARTWWFLVTAGYRAVSVLNGGFNAWKLLGLPSSYIEHYSRTSQRLSDHFLRLNSSINSKDVLKMDAQLLYTSPGDEMVCDLLTPEGLIRPKEELENVFQSFDVQLDGGRVTHTSGEMAGTLLLALRLVGLKRLILDDQQVESSYLSNTSKSCRSEISSMQDEPLTSYLDETQDFISFTEVEVSERVKTQTFLKDSTLKSSILSNAPTTNCSCSRGCSLL